MYACAIWLSSRYNIIVLSLSAVSTKFKRINTRSQNTSIHLPTSHLEANDILKMNFRSTVTDDFVEQLMRFGEFMQDTATVTIVQGKYKEMEHLNPLS